MMPAGAMQLAIAVIQASAYDYMKAMKYLIDTPVPTTEKGHDEMQKRIDTIDECLCLFHSQLFMLAMNIPPDDFIAKLNDSVVQIR